MKTLALILLTVALTSPALAKPKRSLVHDASFDETYERYPSPYDLFFHISRIVPHLDREVLPPECRRLGEENTTVLGGNLPNFGAPLENEPGALFIELYTKCFDAALQAGLQRNDEASAKNVDEILTSKIVDEILAVFPTGNRGLSIFYTWESVSENLRSRILDRLLRQFVGPDVLLEEKELFGENSVFGPEVQTKADLKAVVERVSLANSANKSIFDVIRGAAILLRLGPTVLKQ